MIKKIEKKEAELILPKMLAVVRRDMPVFKRLIHILHSPTSTQIPIAAFAPTVSSKLTATSNLTTQSTQPQSSLLQQFQNLRIIAPSIIAQLEENVEAVKPEEMKLDSVMRKRKLKMKKHKLRKRRKAQKALRIKLKK